MSLTNRDHLVIVDTHPVQYRAPVYRALRQRFDISATVVYGSDFSISGYRDQEFGTSFAWDCALVTEQDSAVFLSRAKDGGASCVEEVKSTGLGPILDRLNPRAVLMTGYQRGFYSNAIRQTLMRRHKILFRAETTDHAVNRGAVKSAVRQTILKTLYGRFSRLLPIGKRSHDHYRNLGLAEEKMVFSRYCVDTASFRCDEDARKELREATRAELNLKADEFCILFSGKLSRRKGPEILVEAARKLQQQTGSKPVICFLGDGAEREALAAQAKAEPEVSVRFTGFQNQSRLSRYYHASDLLVLPSVEGETWGLVVNEAMHHGLPCVVSDGVGCAPDLIDAGKTGYVAATGSSSSLADALKASLEIAGHASTRDNCRAKVSGYTVEKAAEGIASAFHSLPVEEPRG